MTKNWYTTSKEHDLQGLVCDENTGANIAVTYDVKDAPLVAAAPELLEALKALTDAYEGRMSDWENAEFYEVYNNARAAIQKATEELKP